jgi:lysophospholipase L1-like esterase
MKFSFTLNQLRPFITGLPWIDEYFPELRRVPKRVSKKVPNIKGLATNLSGARIRFCSTTSILTIKAKLHHSGKYDHFSNYGSNGFDLYVDGQFYTTFYSKKKLNQKFEFENLNKSSRLCEIYLPLYSGAEEIEIETNAEITPAPKFAQDLPIMYYGSSITQGGCASRAGNSYSAFLSQRYNLDMVNLGFSGNGRGDIEIAHLMAEKPAFCYVLDWGVNLLGEGLQIFQDRYEPFLKTIRDAHPTTPIFLVNLQGLGREKFSGEYAKIVSSYREHINLVHQKFTTAGDQKLWVVDMTEDFGLNHLEFTVDGTHPNDLGFQAYAHAIGGSLEKYLGCKRTSPK